MSKAINFLQKKSFVIISFAKNIGKNLSSKYGQNLNNTKNSATGSFKTVSNRANQKLAEPVRNLIGSKIAGKIAKAVSKSFREDPRKRMAMQIGETSV